MDKKNDKKNEPLRQVGYQPAIRRNASGEIQGVLPYYNGKVIWNLYQQLKAKYKGV